MRIQRLIIAILFTIGLISSTSGAAFSQARMAGGETITICSPDGTHDIVLGASGEPVPNAHECADCCLTSLDLQDAQNLFTTVQVSLARDAVSFAEVAWLTRQVSAAYARGPPSIV